MFRTALVLNLSAYGEPKTVVIRAVSLNIDEAIDNDGVAMIPQTTRRGFGRRFKVSNRELSVPFKRAEDFSRISRLRGSMRLTVQTRSDRWTIDDPLSASPVTALVDSIPVTVESLTASTPAGHYDLLVSIPSEWSSRGSQDELLDLARTRMRVTDAEGHPLSVIGQDSRNTGSGAELTTSFAQDGLPDGTRPGPPAKLIWDIPAETRELAVPFTFKDVVLDPFDQ